MQYDSNNPYIYYIMRLIFIMLRAYQNVYSSKKVSALIFSWKFTEETPEELSN